MRWQSVLKRAFVIALGVEVAACSGGFLEPDRTPSLRAILSGIALYKQTYKTYPPSLSALGGVPSTCNAAATSANACLIDNVLASGEKFGYRYHYEAFGTARSTSFDAFTVTADPLIDERKNQRHYFSDQTGVIRVETGRRATATRPPVN